MTKKSKRNIPAPPEPPRCPESRYHSEESVNLNAPFLIIGVMALFISMVLIAIAANYIEQQNSVTETETQSNITVDK